LTDCTRSETLRGSSGEYRIGSESLGSTSRSSSARRDSRVSPATSLLRDNAPGKSESADHLFHHKARKIHPRGL
jgi:hypothetical protein